MTISDDRIAAWLHGALTAEEAKEIEMLIANGPEAFARAEQLRHLDALVRQAIPLQDSLPPELLARLGLAVSAPHQENIIDFAAARRVRTVTASAPRVRGTTFASGGWRVAAQLLIVVGVGFTAAQWIGAPGTQPPDANYRALGDAPGAESAANALVIFANGTTPVEARAIAGKAGARIIGTPTKAGVWRLFVDPARRDAVLKALRGHSSVTMAEAIDGAGQ
jgi:hypothetical protein